MAISPFTGAELAEAPADVDPPFPPMSRPVNRVHRRRTRSWDVEQRATGLVGRDIADAPRVA